MGWQDEPIIPTDAPIATRDPTDTYPTFFANQGRGGFHTFDTIVDRDALSSGRMSLGMGCHVVETGLDYRLTDVDPATWEEPVGTGIVTLTPKTIALNASGTTGPAVAGTPDADFEITDGAEFKHSPALIASFAGFADGVRGGTWGTWA